ncbi:MAG: preprotein translocase subunit SecA [Candidatus Borkfalkiaceae bacterium]|nr:preprotein translocase subunit SecA [Christensenellaceae bacterium]
MGLIRYILESDSRRSLRKIGAMADKIMALGGKYEKMSDDELRDQTQILKDRYNNGETLDQLLFDAFAVVREASYRVLNMRHYKVQLMGGICVHQGRVAELKTGEGKTLMATLPAYLNALTGKGVHIVTVNDYLAKRDAEWMGKVHRFLGLTVGVNVHDMDDNAKRAAYACDITYGTNNEFGFDYLRDNLKVRLDQMVQRGLNFAIVDEVDSILIDEARTPLIISGRGNKSSEIYISADRFVRELKQGEDFEVDIKEKSVQITESGSRKAERFFGVENIADIENAELNHHIQQALKAHYIFKRDNDYIVQDNEIIIVDEFTGRLMIGRRYSEGLHQAIEAKEHVVVRNENQTQATITFQNYFRLYHKLSGMTGTAKTEEEEFKTIYGLDVLEIPTNRPMIRKDNPDLVYSTHKGKIRAIVEDIVRVHEKGQPVLVGTITVEKSEEISRELLKRRIRHQILNAKNHKREAEIIAQAGKLGAVTIATNMAGRGTDILLGGNPEYLAKQDLRNRGYDDETIELATSYIQHIPQEIEDVRSLYRELLAQHSVVTDEEKKKVTELGGLYILGTERHESRRIDNQLRGRAGRQGDPGESRFYISLEDDLAQRFGGERLQRIYSMFKVDEDTPIEAKMLSRSIENAQRTIEGKNFGIRKHILGYDDVMNRQRMVIYDERMKVLRGENVHQDVLNLIPDYVTNLVNETVNSSDDPTKWDMDLLNKRLEERVLPVGTNFVTHEKLMNWDYKYFINKLIEKVVECYEEKIENYKEKGIDYHEVERIILLRNVDTKWIEHIDAMDKLKRGISLRAYGNEDPLISYKKEGLEMFEELTASIQEDTVKYLLKIEVEKTQRQERRPDPRNYVAQGGSLNAEQRTVVNKAEPGRNDPCPCGSGKKYKNCCGRK